MKKHRGITRMIIVLSVAATLSAAGTRISSKEYAKIDERLFASRHEVTNKEYRLYLRYLQTTGQGEQYQACVYDSAQWVKKFSTSYNEPMEKSYHSHPAYDNYPAVNLTQESAKSYCQWLTDQYNGYSKRKYNKVVFRLPTESEWIRIACPLPDHNLPWAGSSNLSTNGKYYFANIKARAQDNKADDYTSDGGFASLIVAHYKPNSAGIFDIIGNVAEMTDEGLQKGGSWDNYLEESTTGRVQNFKLPDPRVGFRVVMEIIEK